MALTKLPLLHNPQRGHELRLMAADVAFLEDVQVKWRLNISAPASGRNAC